MKKEDTMKKKVTSQKVILRKAVSVLLAVTMLVFTLTGCGSKPAGEAGGGKPKRKAMPDRRQTSQQTLHQQESTRLSEFPIPLSLSHSMHLPFRML